MTTTFSFFGLTILLVSILSCALAAHVPRAVSPIITEPTARAIWILGSVQTVEWITDGLDLDGVEGTVLLGYAHTDGNVTLWKDQPLAENVSLADGVVNVRCPLNLPTTLRYVVALLGDENNISPVFTIEDPSNPVPTNGSVSYPAALQTAGNVPSATLTHTSVVATIPPASSTHSASSKSSESVSSSGTSVQASTTGKPNPSESSNGALVRSVPNSDLLSIIIGLPVLASGLLL